MLENHFKLKAYKINNKKNRRNSKTKTKISQFFPENFCWNISQRISREYFLMNHILFGRKQWNQEEFQRENLEENSQAWNMKFLSISSQFSKEFHSRRIFSWKFPLTILKISGILQFISKKILLIANEISPETRVFSKSNFYFVEVSASNPESFWRLSIQFKENSHDSRWNFTQKQKHFFKSNFFQDFEKCRQNPSPCTRELDPFFLASLPHPKITFYLFGGP